MDSFTVNKIAGAILGTCLVGMGIGIVADEIYFGPPPKKAGYELPKGGAEGEKKPAGVPLSVLLSKADAKRGEGDAKICSACHNFQEGAGNKVGPDLYGVVDRPKGSVKDFDYSPGMKQKGGKWTYADLFEFLKKPSAYVQGTKMGYPGEESPEKRADILAYLRSLSKNPVAFPKVTDADKKAAEGGGGEAKEGGKEGGGDQLIEMIASADPKKGESDAAICGACHNFKEGAGNKVGPDLYGVVDREKGSVKDFDYSAGMKKKGGKWTYADLNQFLTKPAAYVQGTKMGFQGEANEKKRASIIAYLRSLAKTPAPLPKAGGGEKKAEGGGAKEGGGEAGGGDLMKTVAAADPKKGEADTQICRACHNFKEGGGNMVGPNLYGVVDREKGSVQGFDYSAGMKKKGGKWTIADLDQFITKPQAYVQGTKMGYPGEANAKKRAEIIAYLHSLSKSPAPLGGGDAKKSEAAPPAGKPEEKKPEEKKTEAAPAAAKPEEKKSEAAPAAKPDEKKAEDKKTEAAPPPPAKPEEKKTEGAPPPPAKPEEKKTEAAPPPAAKPEEKKTEAAPPPAAKPEQKTEAAPPPSAKPEEKKAEAVPPAKEQKAEGAASEAPKQSANASAGSVPEPYVAVDPMYPSGKVEAAGLPQDEQQPRPASDGESSKSASANSVGGGPEPYSAPSPSEVSEGK